MKPKEILVTATAVLILAALAYVWFTPSGAEQAPDVEVTTLDGKKVRTAQYRGRPLLVTFWATTCSGCVKEMPHLIDLYREMNPRGLEIVAIAMEYDPEDQVRKMAVQRQLPYTVALDTGGTAAKAFGEVRVTPTSFLIDPEGRIVQRKLGELDMEKLRVTIGDMLAERPGASSS